MRVIGDHSASGLNAGIGLADCLTVYDSVVDFLRLIHWSHFQGFLSKDGEVWKLDILSAFKLFVMSLRWQMRQGIIIMCRKRDGSWHQSHVSLSLFTSGGK
ncbi:hypothetical protein JCM5296_003568 [Sporobolomyces johnsonii]